MLPDRAFFQRLADAARKETLPRFRNSLNVVNKLEGGFDPVTEADREAERAIVSIIRKEFPDHGILGEEHGMVNDGADHMWVIDPIDGTRAFISGLPLWGTLIGLTHKGDAIAGMMTQPYIGEFFHADHTDAALYGPHGRRTLKTRGTTALAQATLCTTSPFIFADGKIGRYQALEKQVRLARYGTDCYAYAMLAAGQIDLVVESDLKPYDIVAMIPIIEQAGGVITTWDGAPAEQAGDILAAATPQLHEAAMKALKG
ncbi:histidinol-phosphatase [Limoniibacter endophyticus]|uniref:Histidinol-phosphatase n=1 Tax=Limoniibacter endophyticus TaxID=1565040 RepID=A0A8J3DM81_9HYPH|nr:histidinol-phosphatase [Limoniibacter endophyticus]GHC64101.1 histidinol-phosphatase [Limoniibacter endophyticus]